MRLRTKLLLAAIAATSVLAVSVGTASARRLEFNGFSFRITWSELRFANSTMGGSIEENCPVTLEGTLHSRVITKLSGELIGYVTRADLTLARCRFNTFTEIAFLNGAGGTPNTLPWHLRYEGFSGTLPNIGVIYLQIIGFAWESEIMGTQCLYRSTERTPVALYVFLEAGVVTGISIEPTPPIPKSTGGILCPATEIIVPGGNQTITKLESPTRLAITLVA